MVADLSLSMQPFKPSDETDGCPAENERRVAPRQLSMTPAIEPGPDGVWHVRGYDEARQILRSDSVKQAGFMSEAVSGAGNFLKNMPILFLEGEEHHRMRRETNKFFTPTITDKRYRDFMEAFATSLVARFTQKKRANLSELTMEMALRTAAQVVGLNSSRVPGIGGRLNGVLNTARDLNADKPPNRLRLLWAQRNLIAFMVFDVKPAIRARRKQPREDVISYLITRDYSDFEILTECIVYGVAGMATTREFISTALWHLLDKPHLRQRMLVGEQEERYAILHEILRLEPIVGHLLRRTTADVEIQSEGQTVTIPAGALVDLSVFATNIDPRIMGDDGTSLCPMRPLHSGQGKVPEYVMSFGDGYHRCPGSFLAIQESDILLRKLLAIDTLRIEKTPEIEYNETVKGYEVGDFQIAVG